MFTVTETAYISTIMKLAWNWQNIWHFWQNEYLELQWHILQAVHFTGWTNCSYLRQTWSRIYIFFLMSFFRSIRALKLSFEHTNFGENLFVSADRRWNDWLPLRSLEQNFEVFICGDSYSEFFFLHFKKFKIRAILYEAAEAVGAHSVKDLGYCYMIGWRPNLCVLGHMTGLLFYIHVKLFLPSIFDFVDFWRSMSYFVP